jgi:hypothetical protein
MQKIGKHLFTMAILPRRNPVPRFQSTFAEKRWFQRPAAAMPQRRSGANAGRTGLSAS